MRRWLWLLVMAGGPVGQWLAGLPGLLCGAALAAALATYLARQPEDLLTAVSRLALENALSEVTLVEGSRYIWANASMLRNHGVPSLAELKALSLTDVSPKFQADRRSSAEVVKAVQSLAFRQGAAQSEWTRQRPDGSQYPVLMDLVPVTLAGRSYLFGIHQDITNVVAARQARHLVITDLANLMQGSVLAVADQVRTAAARLTNDAKTLQDESARSIDQLASVAAAVREVSAQADIAIRAKNDLSQRGESIRARNSETRAMIDAAIQETSAIVLTAETLIEAASSIGTIVQVIDDISKQTKLLSLNAAIEAARAGNAGQGFAVVATEVKALASQTAHAVSEVQTRIQAVQGVTTTVTAAIRRVADAVARVQTNNVQVASLMRSQVVTAEQLGQSVQQMEPKTMAVAQTVATVASSVAGTLSMATVVAEQGEHLLNQSNGLIQEVNTCHERMLAA